MFSIDQFEAWNEYTWGDMLLNSHRGKVLSPQTIPYINEFLKKSRYAPQSYNEFSNQMVTGTLSEGWRSFDYVENIPLFQESLVTVINKYDHWTPADFLLEYIADCVAVGTDKLPYHKYPLGRALRNLPSFLREYILHDKLLTLGMNSIMPSVNMNAQSHVDLIINYNGNTFYVWNYLLSKKSLEFLPSKVGNRGRVQSGLNLLAPIVNNSRETDNILNWFIPSDYYIEELIDAMNTAYVPFDKQAMTSKSYYKDMIVFKK